jgi:hypothetical protein
MIYSPGCCGYISGSANVDMLTNLCGSKCEDGRAVEGNDKLLSASCCEYPSPRVVALPLSNNNNVYSQIIIIKIIISSWLMLLLAVRYYERYCGCPSESLMSSYYIEMSQVHSSSCQLLCHWQKAKRRHYVTR